MIKSSFVVDGILQQMRQYTRQYRRLTKRRVHIEPVDVEMLIQCIEQVELIERQQANRLNHLEGLANRYFAKEISLLCTIPSVHTLSALFILSEIGSDMNAFSSASSLVGLAGLRPRNEESAGKIQSRKTFHGNTFMVNCRFDNISARKMNNR